MVTRQNEQEGNERVVEREGSNDETWITSSVERFEGFGSPPGANSVARA